MAMGSRSNAPPVRPDASSYGLRFPDYRTRIIGPGAICDALAIQDESKKHSRHRAPSDDSKSSANPLDWIFGRDSYGRRRRYLSHDSQRGFTARHRIIRRKQCADQQSKCLSSVRIPKRFGVVHGCRQPLIQNLRIGTHIQHCPPEDAHGIEQRTFMLCDRPVSRHRTSPSPRSARLAPDACPRPRLPLPSASAGKTARSPACIRV